MLGWIWNIPEFAQSRKFVILLVTFGCVILLAIIGTLLAWWFDAPTGLFEQAMYLITGTGNGGVVTQGVVDAAKHRNKAPEPGPPTPPSTISAPQRTPPSFTGD